MELDEENGYLKEQLLKTKNILSRKTAALSRNRKKWTNQLTALKITHKVVGKIWCIIHLFHNGNQFKYLHFMLF